MEAICSSETSVEFQQTTRRYIPEDGTLKKTLMLVEILRLFEPQLYFRLQFHSPHQNFSESGYIFQIFRTNVIIKLQIY
jgi:hypothetical protein